MMHADIKIKGVMLSYGREVGVGLVYGNKRSEMHVYVIALEVLSCDWLSRKGHMLFTRVACILFGLWFLAE